MNRIFSLLLIISSVFLFGCATHEDMVSKINNRFDTEKSIMERRANSGEVSWVRATTHMRDYDKMLARIPDNAGYWKYNSDDEEYHSFSIALAERLDKKKITWAQFDAARIQKLNQIKARTQMLRNSEPRSTSCTTRNVGTTLFPEYRTDCN